MAVAMKTVIAKFRNDEFKVAEAAAITGLTTIQVNNLIDEIAPLGIAASANGKRSVQYKGLFALPLIQDTNELATPKLRREIISGALAKPRAKSVEIEVNGTKIAVLVKPSRELIQQGLRNLYEAKNGVSTNPEVMQGEPCIKGTRIPVYTIAKIASVQGVEKAQATYSTLSKRQVELAQLYAKARPRRGRPKRLVIPGKGRIEARRKVKRKK